jgi:ABC-type xylose transport system permease subunit
MSKASVREERSFGLLVGGILAVMGGWWLYRGRFPAAAPWVAGVGGLLVLLGLVAPGLLTTPYRLWMKLAEGMSFVMTRVVLLLVFYVAIVPIGLLRRMMGSDPLRRRAGKSDSYWTGYSPRQRDPKHFEKMF